MYSKVKWKCGNEVLYCEGGGGDESLWKGFIGAVSDEK